MHFLYRLRVGTKLITGFLIVALIGALIGGLGIRSLSQVNSMAEDMYSNETVGIRYAAIAQREMITIGRVLRSTFLASSVAERQNSIKEINTLFADVKKNLNEAKTRFVTSQETQ